MVPDCAVNDLLRTAFFPEMAFLSNHTIADHAAITERLLGEPFTEVHEYIDSAISSLGPHHRAVLHDIASSPGEVAEAFSDGSPSVGHREALAATVGHYLPDSTTPDGIRLSGIRVHLGDLLKGIALVSLAWQAWDFMVQSRRSIFIHAILSKGREALERQDYKMAALSYEAAWRMEKQNARLCFYSGHARRLSGDHATARAWYTHAAELYGESGVAIGAFQVSGRGISLLCAACDAEGWNKKLLIRACDVFIHGCRNAAAPRGIKGLAAPVFAAAGDIVARVSPLTGELLRLPGRVHFPARAVGDAFMAALCEEILQKKVGSWG